MASSTRFPLMLAGLATAGVLLAWSPASQSRTSAGSIRVDNGYPITNQKVIDRCSRCHEVDDQGRMSRISWMRKTPEGWQTSIRRMMALHGVRLNQADAAEIVRYLSNEQGLAPEELRPGMFEIERRSDDHDWDGDSDVETTCIQCHSMGRVMTQRRTEEEWGLLITTHRALYPLSDWQAFRYTGPASEQDDPRHPMERAINHLSDIYALETSEWSAWAATKRPARLTGTWTITGHDPGKGAMYGTMTVTADPSDPDAFTTNTSYVYAESGEEVQRTGRTMLYTGYQWRGRSNPGAADELREVMFVERDQQSIWGRWFRGDYDEIGPDISMQRATGGTVVSGVYPRALEQGASTEVTVYGVGLSDGSELDFGAGITVGSTRTSNDGTLTVELQVDADADVGGRDLFTNGAIAEGAVVIHDGVDRIAVTPGIATARTGGAHFPKGYETFDAWGYDDGPDGEPNTADDLELGRVPANWHIEEYAATYGDDDVDFVGEILQNGTFVPADDGPNPERSGLRNNIGDVWVVATYGSGDRELSARAHLVVMPPLYMRWEPWAEIDTGRRPVGGDR
ncbi:MAG: quinohemoprotein amine dehydrogenase subunit alpha [Longimicrobiales bacterium]